MVSVSYTHLDVYKRQLQDGGLAGPGRPHQKDKFAVVDAHIDPFQGLGPIVIGLLNVDQMCIRDSCCTFLMVSRGRPS